MIEWTQDEQQAVAKVIVGRWPGGVRNQGWQLEAHLEILEAFLSELQFDNLTPHWAMVGLRACDSAFIPGVGQVRALAMEAKGPPTSDDLIAAEERYARLDAERRAARLGAGEAVEHRERAPR